MGAVFLKLLNMSLTAGWIVLAVLLLRLLLKKKAPKALFPILWALVAVRLICPVVVESGFSLIRNPEPMTGETLFSERTETVEPPAYPESTDPEEAKKFAEEYQKYIDGLEKRPEKAIVSIVSGPVDTGNSDEVDYYIQKIDPDETALPEKVMEELKSYGKYTETTEDGITNTYTLVYETTLIEQKPSVYEILAVIWIIGVAGMLFYMLFSYLRIYRKVKESAIYEKNIRICDGIDSPFILGVIRPRIYLPSDIAESDRDFVLAHERAHLKRLDHIWKPFGFLLLSIYWFHPLLWVAYIFLCKDIEFACDEKVIKELGTEQKKAYSTALINCSVSRKTISACPLAFGENGVKGRVKSVLHYKKPAFWIILVSVIVCVIMAVCFLTNPKGKDETTEKTLTPAVTATPGVTSVTDATEEKESLQNKRPVTGDLTEKIESTNISIAIGDKYAAYLDADGKIHVLYDTSLIWDYDTVGATGGIDTSKSYQSLGTDPWRLVAIDKDGRPFASYHMTVDELSDYVSKALEETMAAGGNYGTGGPQPWIAKEFEEMSGVKQIFSTYPYQDYTVLFDDGRVYRHGECEALEGAVQITKDVNGILAGIKADGTVVMTEIGDPIRKKKLDTWPKKLKQICAGSDIVARSSIFVGLCEDGTVISEGIQQNYLINTEEKWSGIVKIAVAEETVIGLKGDGTVVAVCPARSDVGQCDVDDWTDVIAVNTNGKVTVGITKDGKVLMAGQVPELVTVTGTTDGDFSNVEFARVMPDGSLSFEEDKIKDRNVLIRPAIWVDVTKLPKPDWMN